MQEQRPSGLKISAFLGVLIIIAVWISWFILEKWLGIDQAF